MGLTMTVAASRIVRAATATLSFQGTDADGEPADPGVVTVKVERSDGTVVKAAGTATTGSGTTARTVALTATDTGELDVLTASWSSGGQVIGVTTHEIVGGVYVTVAEIRALEPALSSVSEYTSAQLIAARRQVEALFEDTCNRAFVPRFRVDVLAGDAGHQLVLRRPDVRSVRWLKVGDGAGGFTAVPVGELDVDPTGLVVWRDDRFPRGGANVQVGYEYGLERPPADLRLAAVQTIRSMVNTFRSGIPDRATSFQPIDGGNVVLATPGLGPWVTGIPSVDECLKRYRWKGATVA